MPKFINVPFLILTLSLILGIFLGYYNSIDLTSILTIQVAAIVGLISSWWYAKKMFRKSYAFSMLTIVTFIIFGITLVQIHHPKNKTTQPA